MFPEYPAGAVSAGSVAGSWTGSAMTACESTIGSCIGSAMVAGESTTGSCTGSAMVAGESTTGSCTGSAMTGEGDSTTGTTGTGFLMTRGGWVVDCGLLLQAGEKFPGPHTYCAEAGGAAAR